MSFASGEHRKVIKFLLVGGLKTVLMYGLFMLLVHIGLHYNFALTMDYAVGIVFGYLLNRFWVFASQGRPRAGFVKYVVTYGLVFATNLLLLNVAVRVAGLTPELGQVPALALATAASYCLLRFWVFRSA